jgi:hypothetical protein
MASSHFISSHFILYAHAFIFIPVFSTTVHPRNNNKIVSYKTHPIDKYSDMQISALCKKWIKDIIGFKMSGHG